MPYVLCNVLTLRTTSHEYHIIQAFAANGPAKAFESVQTMGKQHNVVIEEDKKMSINT